MPTPDLSTYNELFFKTADEHLNAIRAQVIKLSGGINNEILSEIYRRVHSLKGSSSVMGYSEISDLCSEMLDFLSEDFSSDVERLKNKTDEFANVLENKIKNIRG